MQFEYEIGPGEYIASQVLYFKMSRGRQRLRGVAISILGALLLILAALSRVDFGWDDFLLILLAIWWLYAGFKNLFPAMYYRRTYRSMKLAGKKFKANIENDEFEVVGEDCAWRVRWTAVGLKGENETAFMICSATGTIFMFGKKYLTDDQQHELRRLAGLASS